MRRTLSVVLLAVAALAAVAPAAAWARPGTRVPPSLLRLAKANYAAFRHAARPADHVVDTKGLPPDLRTRLRTAEVRRIASGPGWKVFLALGRPSGPRHMEADLFAEPCKDECMPASGTLRRFVRDGVSAGGDLPDGRVFNVALVPDGARDAKATDLDGIVRPLPVARNAIVATSVDDRMFAWTMPGGRFAQAPVNAHGGTLVTATVLDGSTLTADFGSGDVRTLALGGRLRGVIRGGYRLSRDNVIHLTKGAITVAPTDVLTDACAAPALARINPATTITLDAAHPADATVLATGDVSTAPSFTLRTVLDLRPTAGCGATATPSGYADSAIGVALSGKVAMSTGLAALTLDSAPTPATVQACLTPGDAAKPCTEAPTPLTVTTTVHAVVNVSFG